MISTSATFPFVALLMLVLALATSASPSSSAEVSPTGDISSTSVPPPAVFIIGAAGAIGSQLTAHLLMKGIPVVAGLRRSKLPAYLTSHPLLVTELGVDCQNAASIERVLANHPSIETVWNLAAPLSVETSSDPALAYDVVVNGMDRLLKAMRKHNVPNICFSDSIGSYGASAPREGATARWLVENPTQDPGSDYGVQKRACRDLMQAFASEDSSRSSRFAVIPGVLHDDERWGAGTTEYALDAIKAAVAGTVYDSAVEIDVLLPMIMRDDLIDGLYRLTTASKEKLREVDGGYAIAGFSFTARSLFSEIAKVAPDFQYVADAQTLAESPAALFARLWPDSLSGKEAERDLGFKAKQSSVEKMVADIYNAHKH